MMKDEDGGESISEFVGLKSKLYAYKMDDGKADKKLSVRAYRRQ